MLNGAIDALSGGLHLFVLMIKLTGGTALIKKYICRPPDSTSMAPISIATMQDTSVDLN